MKYPRKIDLMLERRRARSMELPADKHGYLFERPTAEWVRRAYQLILGREPESISVVSDKLQHPNIDSLRRELLNSQEFRLLFPEVVRQPPDPSQMRDRLTVAFIHIPKTGGTSVRKLLEGRVFDRGRPCVVAPLLGQLYEYPPATLAQFDVFSGHFDYESMRYIPRNDIRVMCFFRDPVERLISLYRYNRAQIPGAMGDNEGPHVPLANRLSAEEFFEHPQVRSAGDTFNTYLLTIGRSQAWYLSRREALSQADLEAALEDATARIRRMAVVGIAERYAESVDQICRALSIERPAVLEVHNVTDEASKSDQRFKPSAPVERTPRLMAALEELIVYDRRVYEFALGEFDRRQAEPTAG